MAPSQTATTQLPIVGSVLWSKCIPGRDVWQCCAGHIRRLGQTTVCKHTWTLWLKLQTLRQNLYPSRHYMWSRCPSLLQKFTLKVFQEPYVEVVCIRTQRDPTGTYMSSFTNIMLPSASCLNETRVSPSQYDLDAFEQWRSWKERHLGGGDPSEAHSALIHVDAHLILITKMQFPASQRRLIGMRRCKCFFAQCLQQDGWPSSVYMTNCLGEIMVNRQ